MPSFWNLRNSVLALAVFGMLILAHGNAKADAVGVCAPDSLGQCSAGNFGGGTPTSPRVAFTITLASLNGNTEQSIFNSKLIHQKGFQDSGSNKDALTAVPEPTTMLLLGTGLIGIAGLIRKRFAKK